MGSCKPLRGTVGNIPYDIFSTKDPEYAMKIMATYGGLTAKEGKHIFKRIFKVGDKDQVACFGYTEPFANHFDLRHMVDDHNNLRLASPSLE